MSIVANTLPESLAETRPVVHKFGGSSLADADGIRRCADIVIGELTDRFPTRILVVVSAPRGITDALLELAADAAASEAWPVRLTGLHDQVRIIARRLLDATAFERFSGLLQADIARLQNILATCNTLRVAVPQACDEISAYGELWSMQLFAAAAKMRGQSAELLDAREVIRVADKDGKRSVDWENSCKLFAAHETKLRERLVIMPGYIARAATPFPSQAANGAAAMTATMTLGRNGSDWSATILARLANASVVTIWSDVAGVLEADPDIVPNARPHAAISRGAAGRLAAAGARILHPETLAPLHDSDTRVCVRSSFDTASEGTWILPEGVLPESGTLENELPGVVIAARHIGQQQLAVTAAGPMVSFQHAIAALDNARIGFKDARCGEDSVQLTVAAADATRTQRILHRALCLRRRELSVALLGVGNVGSEVLRQLSASVLSTLRLVGVADSRAMLFNPDGMLPETALARLRSADTASNADALAARLLETCESAPVIIDATASETVAARHADWQAKGIHVVTANKLALANGWVRGGMNGDACYGDSATVGAGLPVLSAIRRLRAAGDSITRIEGVLSGSLAYLFHEVQQGAACSDAVLSAVRQGFAEPDPRQDLSGLDVARKLRILADAAGIGDALKRQSGLQAESLLPPTAMDLTLEEFLASLPDADAHWRQRCAAAEGNGGVLRYVACLDSNAGDGDGDGTEIEIGVRELPRDHPLAQTRGTENCVSIYSRSYASEPLVIRGPGAGAAVTARGLLADTVDVLARHGR